MAHRAVARRREDDPQRKKRKGEQVPGYSYCLRTTVSRQVGYMSIPPPPNLPLGVGNLTMQSSGIRDKGLRRNSSTKEFERPWEAT
ncbi:hypothetical protein CEXT_682511 [Caerostris extrusa]|uniref:Uncharacterized protein n=1 Tax=Caerostris extrusa TaxID=172846 RepID=A0AAV4NFH0_CAEEX|nr:hypothetical protein CEXT_682511 [Caerostris extrusa]